MEWEAIAAINGGVSGTDVVCQSVVLQFIHLFEVPRQRTLGSVNLERVLAFGADQRSAHLKRSGCTVLEVTQHRGEVFVFDVALGVFGATAAVVACRSRGQRALRNGRIAHSYDVGDVPDEVLSERHGVAENVARDPITSLVEDEAPCQKTELVTSVH